MKALTQAQASIHLSCSSFKSNNRPSALQLCVLGVPTPPPPGRSQWGRRGRRNWSWNAWKLSSLTCQPVLAASMANSCNFTKTWVAWNGLEWLGGAARLDLFGGRFSLMIMINVIGKPQGNSSRISGSPCSFTTCKWNDHQPGGGVSTNSPPRSRSSRPIHLNTMRHDDTHISGRFQRILPCRNDLTRARWHDPRATST